MQCGKLIQTYLIFSHYFYKLLIKFYHYMRTNKGFHNNETLLIHSNVNNNTALVSVINNTGWFVEVAE